MNTVRPLKFIFCLLFAFGLALNPVLRAQDKPAEPPPAPAAPAAPAETAEPEAPIAEPAEDKPVRDLAASDSEKEGTAEVAPKAEQESEPAKDDDDHRGRHRSRHSGNERISFFSDSSLAAGEEAQAVVSIIGSSTSGGEVNDAVVSIIGGSRVTGGTVGDTVLSVLGNTYINGHVRGEVVTVLGNVEFGPKAVVEGEVVCIGGQITRDDHAEIKGDIHHIAVAGKNFDFTGLTTWFQECLMYARPLAFHRDLFWAWTIAFGLLVFYALIALIAPAGVVKCVETLEERPGYSLLAALLTLLLTPVAYILLALTIAIAVGVVLIPVFSLGLFIASLFGKIVMLAWLGRRFTKLLGDGPLAHPVFGVLIGGLIVLGLYTIPIAGFIVYKLLGILGLGVVVYTLILQFKASRPPKPVAPSAPTGGLASVPPVMAGVVTPAASGLTDEATPAFAPPASAAPPVISVATLPRAGFWIRIAAVLLDAVLVGIVFGMLDGIFGWFIRFGGSFPLWFAVYNVVMWGTKGTTIGGIICSLKVVRLDDRPLDWSVAVVRGLGAFLSLAVAGLGFIWVAFDDERQSWHDKIAGTTIVKVPKGTALF